MRVLHANVGQLANIEKYAKSVAAGLFTDLLSHVSLGSIFLLLVFMFIHG